MSLFPVDRHKKWGYGGPVGLFFDPTNFAIIKEHLGSDNLQKMKVNFHDLHQIKDLLPWFEEQPDLSEKEIEKSWQDFIADKPNSDVQVKEDRLAIFKAYFRTIGWSMNYFHEPQSNADEISDEILEKAWRRINNW